MPQLRNALILSAAGMGAVAALLTAPIAGADPGQLPQCQEEGGGAYGGGTAECATPGNVQIDSSPQVFPAGADGSFYGFPGFGF